MHVDAMGARKQSKSVFRIEYALEMLKSTLGEMVGSTSDSCSPSGWGSTVLAPNGDLMKTLRFERFSLI